MKNRRLIILPVLVVAAVTAVYLYFQDRPSRNPDIIRISGNIEVTEANVSFKIAGRVEERLVAEGQTVKAGDVVARLESAELKHEVELRKAELRAAQAELAELEAGSRPEEIAQAEAALALAAAEENRLRAEFERHKQLYEQKAISSSAYDAAEAAYRVAQARRHSARENLTLLQKGPRQETIEQGRARFERARHALALAETRLGYATLTAPFAGVVLSKNVEPGEYVVAGTPVVTIGNLERPWLRAYVPEAELGRLKLGQRVRVTTDTYPGKVYEGTLSFIASEAEFTPKNVQTQKERVRLVYRVKVDVHNPEMELKPGMPADAEILLK